jgi:uncharacterized damage-inducible protein DinB
MTIEPYSQLIHCKRWADRNLHEAVADNFDRLDAEEKSIIARILDHIHAVDRIFRCHLMGQAHDFTAARSGVLPGIDELAATARFVDDWYVSYVDGLPAAAFDEPVAFTFTSGKPARMTRGEIILHVCMHGAYHRGNAGILFQKKGLRPGRDSITDYLEATALEAAA